jgi:hypothetical protein
MELHSERSSWSPSRYIAGGPHALHAGPHRQVDGVLMSYATIMSDEALADARAAEQEIAGGRYRGPLHGVPIAVKDLCYTKGCPYDGRHCRPQGFCAGVR